MGAEPGKHVGKYCATAMTSSLIAENAPGAAGEELDRRIRGGGV
jgi:hypothetical protein